MLLHHEAPAGGPEVTVAGRADEREAARGEGASETKEGALVLVDFTTAGDSRTEDEMPIDRGSRDGRSTEEENEAGSRSRD